MTTSMSNNPTEVEWAIARGCKATRRHHHPRPRAKPLDPSLYIPPGQVPQARKVGIDATIARAFEGGFERISTHTLTAPRSPTTRPVKRPAGDRQARTPSPSCAKKIAAAMEAQAIYYSSWRKSFSPTTFATVARAFGRLHCEGKLLQDGRGRICLKGSKFAAKP